MSLFRLDGTFGPKANFKISVRELPDHGHFRVTVTAAKYNDGLLLDKSDAAQPRGRNPSAAALDPEQTSTVRLERGGTIPSRHL